MIRWTTLNFKIFVLILKFKKYRVRRFVHGLVRVIDKYRYGENLVANPKIKKWEFSLFYSTLLKISNPRLFIKLYNVAPMSSS
jgi:hypothetical protein